MSIEGSRWGTMIRTVLFVILAACAVHCRVFDNPLGLLNYGDTPDPGTIKVDGVYYIVTTTNNGETNKFPIHTSTDLKNWTLAGYVLTADNLPAWSNKDQIYWAPEFHRVNNRFHVYYTGWWVDEDIMVIGVATADNVLGPYKSPDKPVYRDPNWGVFDSNIINDNGTLYLMWKGSWSFWARQMNPDGLSFPDGPTTELFHNDQPWEGIVVEGPWHLRRGDYHYIFYSGNNTCGELYSVGVARSRNPLGPYEKRGDPILISNKLLKGPGHNSVVKDLNDVDDLIVFHALSVDSVCGPENPWAHRMTCLASIGWRDDGWPYIYDWQD